MSSLPSEYLEKPKAAQVPKTRTCLRCQTRFKSAWAGERICSRCKGTSAWRAGVPLPIPSTRARSA